MSWSGNYKPVTVNSGGGLTMKKKAYEYSKEELLEMIKVEENKLIKSGGLKALKVAFFSSIGLSWVPFI